MPTFINDISKLKKHDRFLYHYHDGIYSGVYVGRIIATPEHREYVIFADVTGPIDEYLANRLEMEDKDDMFELLHIFDKSHGDVDDMTIDEILSKFPEAFI